jgi:hypothetical protein
MCSILGKNETGPVRHEEIERIAQVNEELAQALDAVSYEEQEAHLHEQWAALEEAKAVYMGTNGRDRFH